MVVSPAGESEQNAAEAQGQKQTHQVIRVTWAGLAANLVLAGLKFAAGLIGCSQAVLADGVHTLSDVSTDLAVLVGVRYWSQPADESHPHGHRRIETIVTTFISLVLVGVAVGLTYRALNTLAEKHLTRPRFIALAAACVSILSKELLYRWTAAVGRRVRSSAVVANAWHHRSDALSSIPVVLAVGGAMIYPSWSFLDHIGAVVVSLFVIQAAWKIGWPALKQLVDAGAPLRDRERTRAVAQSTPHVKRVHAIRTRYIGSGIQVDLHIMVDGNLTVREGHDISEAVKQRLLSEGPDILDVVVHLEPHDTAAGPG